MQPELTLIASGLAFPEGPIALPDGSIILVEIKAGRLTRVRDGQRKPSQTLAEAQMARLSVLMGSAMSATMADSNGSSAVAKFIPASSPLIIRVAVFSGSISIRVR